MQIHVWHVDNRLAFIIQAWGPVEGAGLASIRVSHVVCQRGEEGAIGEESICCPEGCRQGRRSGKGWCSTAGSAKVGAGREGGAVAASGKGHSIGESGEGHTAATGN